MKMMNDIFILNNEICNEGDEDKMEVMGKVLFIVEEQQAAVNNFHSYLLDRIKQLSHFKNNETKEEVKDEIQNMIIRETNDLMKFRELMGMEIEVK